MQGQGEGSREMGEKGEVEEERRKSRKRNREGKSLVEFIKERGSFILNGGVEGDENRKWTYIGARRESVIDYVIVGEELAEEIKRLEVGGQIDSDHHPVVVWIGRGRREGVGRGEGRGRGCRRSGMRWVEKSLGER